MIDRAAPSSPPRRAVVRVRIPLRRGHGAVQPPAGLREVRGQEHPGRADQQLHAPPGARPPSRRVPRGRRTDASRAPSVRPSSLVDRPRTSSRPSRPNAKEP
eukprot:30971-Pelagococcus_subviridis.AAC.2